MYELIIERIRFYQNEVALALDRNDSIAILKNIAIQKELENLISKQNLHANIELDTVDPNNYYDCKDVAAIYGIHPSMVTRMTALKGQKIKGKWQFLKQVVEDYKPIYLNKKRRGKKPQITSK